MQQLETPGGEVAHVPAAWFTAEIVKRPPRGSHRGFSPGILGAPATWPRRPLRGGK